MPRLGFLCGFLILALSGCDFDSLFPCGAPENEEDELEVWSLDLNQPSRSLLLNDFKEDQGDFKEDQGRPDANRYRFVGVSPEATLLYYTYEHYSDTTVSLRARDLRTASVIDVGFESSDQGFTISPDGTRFAFLRAGRALWVANRDGGQARKIAEVPSGYISEGTWVDEDHVAYTPNGKGVYLVSLLEQGVTQLSEADSLYAFAVAPDLTTVAYTRWVFGWNGYSGISVLAYAEDATGARFLGEGSGNADRDVIKFAQGGDRLVYFGALSKTLILADRDGSTPRIVVEVPAPYLQELQVDRSGERVLFFEQGVLKQLNPSTGAVSTVQSAQDIPNDESNWRLISVSLGPLVFGPTGNTIYVLVRKHKSYSPCDG